MKPNRMIYALAVAWLLALAWPAHALTASPVIYNLFPAGSDDTTAVGMADSSRFVATKAYQRNWLFLKPSRPCRVAISVYAAGINDTTRTTLLDTTMVYIWPWRGGAEVAATAGSDSLSFRETIAPTSVTAASYEMIYEFPAAAAGKWGSPRGRAIALHGVDGVWYNNDYTRIRLRVLSASGVVTWRGYLKSFAW